MSLKLNERYPGRFSNPTTAYPQGAFKNRTAPSSQDGSYLEQDWANDWQGFFSRLLTVAGVTANGNVDTATNSQYFDALSSIILQSSAPSIGVPFFWPSAAMPNTVIPEWSGMVFLKFNGATFSATAYPKLALIYPTLALRECRGEFLRVWDDGRGVDSGRTLLSAQGDAIRNMTGLLTLTASGATSAVAGAAAGVFALEGQNVPAVISDTTSTQTRNTQVSFDASRAVPTAGENRPRNIAFNFLVRAK